MSEPAGLLLHGNEPTGASNDAPSKFGPPKFKDGKFLIESPALTLAITINRAS